MNYLLGIPVVVLSSLVGTSIFYSLQQQLSKKFQFFFCVTSILVPVLAALQTFLRFGERTSKHQTTASEYGSIKREIQQLLAVENNFSAKELNEVTNRIRDRMDFIAKEAPGVPTYIMKDGLKQIPTLRNYEIEEKLLQKG